MALELNAAVIEQIIKEINDDAEVSRRAKMKRRHDIFKDGGKAFLLEQLSREFDSDGIKEMRLAPVSVLKKVISKLAGVYKAPPKRQAQSPQDQDLVDFYTEELDLNSQMQKANRYFELFSNTVLYPRIKNDFISLSVVPPYLYSVVPNAMERDEIDAFVFSAFLEEGRVAPLADVPSASGGGSFSRERGYQGVGDRVASNEKSASEMARRYILWTKNQHFSTDAEGNVFALAEMGPEQFVNPFAPLMPVVNIAKDRDNEPWACQGDDLVDLALLIQLGWSDVMTIAKHQGYGQLTITSEEEPKQLKLGINKAVHLKQRLDGVVPSMQYISANAPLAEYMNLLSELLGLLLSTNNLSQSEVGGDAARQFNSGFQAMIEMSSTLEVIEANKPTFRNAEKEFWQVVKAMHNFMFDQNILRPDARAFGRFSDDFTVSVTFADIKPIESEQERLASVKSLMDMGLVTKRDALKKLNPDLSDDDIDAKLKEIGDEKKANMEAFNAQIDKQKGQEDGEEEEKETNEMMM